MHMGTHSAYVYEWRVVLSPPIASQILRLCLLWYIP